MSSIDQSHQTLLSKMTQLDNNMWSCVEFIPQNSTDDVYYEAIPNSWLRYENGAYMLQFPTDISSFKLTQLINKKSKPHPDWNSFLVNVPVRNKSSRLII